MNKKSIWHRGEKVVGQPMLVKLPTGDEWKDSKEGGLAFFLVIPRKEREQRCVCIAGNIQWHHADACIDPPEFEVGEGRDVELVDVDAALLIGSTGQSLWSKKDGYFHPTFEDLTEEGKTLYCTLEKMYGEATIVTLLDT